MFFLLLFSDIKHPIANGNCVPYIIFSSACRSQKSIHVAELRPPPQKKNLSFEIVLGSLPNTLHDIKNLVDFSGVETDLAKCSVVHHFVRKPRYIDDSACENYNLLRGINDGPKRKSFASAISAHQLSRR